MIAQFPSPRKSSLSDRGCKRLWENWVSADVEVVAPPLLLFEGTCVICNRMHRGLVPREEAELMLQAFHLLSVRLLYPEGLHETAWALAVQFSRPRAYDSFYLALAEMLDLEFWTADERLYQLVHRQLPWVQWLGNYDAT